MMNRKMRKQLPAMIAMGVALVLGVVGTGYLGMQAMNQKTADEYGCYSGLPSAQTMYLTDVSEPRWSKAQQRSIATYIERDYSGLRPNERFAFYSTAVNTMASVVVPEFHVCGQARNSSEHKAMTGDEVQDGYLARQREKQYEEYLAPRLSYLLNNAQQLHESPILELIRAASRDANLRMGDKLRIVSDMIQNSELARFCRVQNDLPRFTTFAKQPRYIEHLHPSSMDGVEVEILMLERPYYGTKGMEYCTELEIKNFWRDYFKANGARSVNFIRLRMGTEV